MGVIEANSEQFERLMAAIERDERASAAEMPNEAAALKVLQQAYVRLKALGFRDAVHCPKDGSWFEIVEAGSTGIHRAHYEGQWPTGTWWVAEAGDLWPSRPILWRPTREDGSQAPLASDGEVSKARSAAHDLNPKDSGEGQ